MKILLFLSFFLSASALVGQPQPGDFFTRGPANQKRISLTFDDGPGRNTRKFLDLLDQHNVKGTFFMLGQQVETRPEMAREVAQRGHEVASHTYNHRNYLKHAKAIQNSMGTETHTPDQVTAKSKTDLVADMRKTRLIIEKATGRTVRICRMPHGIDRPWIKTAAKEDGVVLVNWTFGADWTKKPLEELKKAYVGAINPGAILLFHDDGKNWAASMEIVESVILSANAQGYSIVPVGSLLGLEATGR